MSLIPARKIVRLVVIIFSVSVSLFVYVTLDLLTSDARQWTRRNGQGAPLIENATVPISDQKKLMVAWTKFQTLEFTDFYFRECPDLRQICRIGRRSEYAAADAIIFHPPDTDWSNLPPSRTSEQIYVFVMHESASNHYYRNTRWDARTSFFNWSMTYRMDSDVPFPYGYILPDASARSPLDTVTILNKSSSGLAWFVTNPSSTSHRERYVRQLKKHMPVDVYGLERRDCPQAVDEENQRITPACETELLNHKYKFYLAFENNICLDYITEKFYYRWWLQSVPVVLSRRIAQHLLPPMSFVAVDDFPDGPKQLADYLKYLMKNDAEYLKYFEWKRAGYMNAVRHPVTGWRWGVCGLCERLWDLGKKNYTEMKTYQSVEDWWVKKAHCDNELVDRLIKNEELLAQ